MRIGIALVNFLNDDTHPVNGALSFHAFVVYAVWEAV